MVSCLKCGQEIPPSEYSSHYASCVGGARWERVSPERISPETWKTLREADKRKAAIRGLLDDMRSSTARRDFESMLRAGMEALVEVGRAFPSETSWAASGASVYNSIAISLLSAYKSDWDTATRFATQAVEDTGRGY